jgi:hypothetical protein
MANFFDELVAWLKANRAQLTKPLASSSLYEACDKDLCNGMPSSGMGKHEKATWLLINGITCTEALFQCGRNPKHPCDSANIAARLGAGCDPPGKLMADPLFARATGVQLNR